MGVVFRAHDTKLGRDVAIKVLPDAFATDRDRLARFEREAQVLASLNHSNIAQIYGLEESNHTHCIVMELVEGPTLAESLRGGPLPIEDALLLAKQIAEALEAAHERGIVHRDLKPANIKTNGGQVKVLDFGLAKMGDPGEAADLSKSPTMSATATHAGVILGTAAYMSPEQAKGKTADARSDIWAFGVVLYEMLTGRQAFAGETVMEILGGVMKAEPDWSALPPTTPPIIRALLRRCLQKDPSRRLRDIADARFQIEEALTEPPAAPAIAPRQSAHQWLMWTAVIVLAVAAGVASARYFGRAPADAPEARLQIGTGAGDPLSFAISPDGSKIVYSAPAQGRFQLFVRSLQSEAPAALLGTEGASDPFWSPDSQSIGFFSGGKLNRIDIAGGGAQTIADLPAVPAPRGGAWNRDGVILIGRSSGLLRLSAAGGQPVALTTSSPPQTGHRFPQFLPDGRHFFFYVNGTPEVRGVYIGSLDSKETQRLGDADTTGVFAPPDLVLFARAGTLYAQHLDLSAMAPKGDRFVVTNNVETGSLASAGQPGYSVSLVGTLVYRGTGRGTERQLTWFDRVGKPLATLGDPDRADSTNPRLSSDGRYVVIQRRVNGNDDLWLMETARGVLRRITFDPVYEGAPVWSPDGTQLFFNSYLKGKTDLYVMSIADAKGGILLVDTINAKTPGDWSSDGRFILYDGAGTLWALPLQGDRKPFPFDTRVALSIYARFSPDCRWVASESAESGNSEIYIQPFPGPGAKKRISTTGGRFPEWRRDGRELFYLTPDDRLMAVALTPSGQTLDVGTPSALFTFHIQPPPAPGHQYAVAPDGQRFLVNTVLGEGETAPLTVVLNWKAKP